MSNTRNSKRRKTSIKYYNCPEINSIQDLIVLCKSVKLYKNINMNTLWKIENDLINLNN